MTTQDKSKRLDFAIARLNTAIEKMEKNVFEANAGQFYEEYQLAIQEFKAACEECRR